VAEQGRLTACGVAFRPGVRGKFRPQMETNSRTKHVLPIAAITLVISAICVVVALAIDWLPDPASQEADRVDQLTWWTVWVSIAIFASVMGVMFYSVWRFRAKDGDESDGPPIHGHTMLEVVWTAIPTVLLAITAAWAAIVLAKNEEIAKAGQGPLRVEVLAQQFNWEFTYPDLGVTTGDLRVPVGRQVVLNLHAKETIHSFFVYETRIKGDAVPGIENDLVRFTMKPEYAGRDFPIVCTELCGAGHGIMRAQMKTLSTGDYDAWAAEAKASAAEQAAKTPPPPPPTTTTTP
jgi:cytochrome c oxidase subunit II